MYVNASGKTLATSAKTNNWINSTSASETLVGTAKNDVFQAAGGDRAFGGAGDDVYHIWDNSSAAFERAGEGIDTLIAHFWGTAYLPDNFENLTLSGKGTVKGFGNDQDNIVSTDLAGAWLNGLGGDDVLIGGAGRDTFEIVRGNGSDVVVGFTSGQDIIRLDGYGLENFAAVQAGLKQVGADVHLALAGGEKLILRNISLADLDATDFRLVDLEVSSHASDTFSARASNPGEVQLVGPGKCMTAFGWYVLNNAWGAGKLVHGEDYQLHGSYNRADMTGGTTFNWDFPVLDDMSVPSVLAYPEVIFGAAPKGARANPTDKAMILPVQVSDLHSLTVNHDVTISGDTRGFNVSYDIWLTDTPYGGADTITNELMIWLHQGGFEPFGQRVGTYQNGDFAATIYHDAASKYTAVVANSDSLVGTLDLHHLLGALEGMGIVSPSSYVASIELGAEVVSGHGTLTINNLDFRVETVDENGVVTSKLATGSGAEVTTYVLDDAPGGAVDNDDFFTSSAAAERFDGGTGTDTASYRDLKRSVTVSLETAAAQQTGGGGMDTLISIENLEGSSAADKLTGNAAANQLVGNAGNDTLSGRAGDDHLEGGAGVDQLFGGAGNDRLEGGSESDSLYGEAGDDVLDGGVGSDLLAGGDGNDTYYVDSTGDRVIEEWSNGHGGIDTVFSSSRFVLGSNVEHLTLTGTANNSGIGNELANTITGNSGNNLLRGMASSDTLFGGEGDDRLEGGSENDSLYGGDGDDELDGGTGLDRLEGGNGNDKYYIDAAGDQVIEHGNDGLGGIDTVFASVSYTLGGNLEHLTLTGVGDINGTGNEAANTIAGNGGNNHLRGGAASDTLYGGADNDRLEGGTENDYLFGDSGNDVLDGGAGQDMLTGGGGKDIFLFASAREANGDQIMDFVKRQDRIDLSQIDASSDTSGNGAFTFIGSDAFTQEAGQLRVQLVNGSYVVSGDTDGNGLADFSFTVNAEAPLAASDFIL